MTTLSPSLRSALTASAGGRTARASAWALAATIVVLLVHVWLVSAGRWTHWPNYSARYDLLATAFASGQAHLTVPADPALLALPDPYHPIQNQSFRRQPGVHDACLYDGRLYYYWGPAPALILMPAKLIAGDRLVVADEHLCFAFAAGLVIVSALMLLRIRERYFPSSPAWLPGVGVLLCGLSAPITCMMTRAAVYEVAILGGQFFLLAGIYLSWKALTPGDVRTDPSLRLLFSAGACLATAVACRISLAIAVTAISLLVVVMLLRNMRATPGAALRRVSAFGLPLVATAIALAAYNQARFGSPLEFGQKYQLAGQHLRALPSLFGPQNVAPGLWSYFLRPVAVSADFPFLLAITGDDTFPSFIRVPPGYDLFERIAGIVWTVPFLWLLPIGLIVAFRHGPRSLLIMLSLGAVLSFAPVLLMIGSSQRYLADLTPALTIIAMIGLWSLSRPVPGHPRQQGRRLAIGVGCAAITVLVGILVSIDGYGGHFRQHYPDLLRMLGGAPSTAVTPAVPSNTGSPS